MTSIDDKLAFMNMTLDDKIKRTKQLIMEWYWEEKAKTFLDMNKKFEVENEE